MDPLFSLQIAAARVPARLFCSRFLFSTVFFRISTNQVCANEPDMTKCHPPSDLFPSFFDPLNKSPFPDFHHAYCRRKSWSRQRILFHRAFLVGVSVDYSVSSSSSIFSTEIDSAGKTELAFFSLFF